jgi:hypothetical protein
MDAPRRSRAATLLGVPAALFALALAPPAAGAEGADGDEGSVVQGTWTVEVQVVNDTPNFGVENTTWTYHFGDGCTVGTACTVKSETEGVTSPRTALKPSAQGFTFAEHELLDCHDTVTGAVSTRNGAVYDLDGQLNPATKEERDGVSYITSMSGTIVETIEITAAGRADNCSIDGAGLMSETQTAQLTGAPVPLPAPPGGSAPDPVGVDPASANSSGTLPEFTFARSDIAQDSASAVSEGRRSSVPGALVVPSDALDSVGDGLLQDLLLVAVLGLLMVFPAQIFNSTYEENHERIKRAFGRFGWRRARAREPDAAAGQPDAGPAESPPPGRLRRVGLFVACALVGTVLGGLLDPDVGANQATYALLTGVFVALLVAVLVALVSSWVFRSARHHPHGWYLRAIPSALLVAVLGVVVSRLTHFEPGYLYGVLGGAVFLGVLERRTEGRVETVTLTAGLGVALLAWVAFEPVAELANESDAPFPVLVADALLGCLFIGGIEGLLFSLIPLRFLPGFRVRQWGWVPWGLLTLLTAYLFVHVLLVPESGYLGRSTSVSATVTIALFAAFGVASGLFWLWFRLRPDPANKPGPTDQPSGQDSTLGLGGPMDGGPMPVPT